MNDVFLFARGFTRQNSFHPKVRAGDSSRDLLVGGLVSTHLKKMSNWKSSPKRGENFPKICEAYSYLVIASNIDKGHLT